MQRKTLVACAAAALLAAGIACSNDSESPVSPTGTEPGAASADASGKTLKATAPALVSPVNNAQPTLLELVANKATARFSNNAAFYLYEFEIRRSGNAVPGCTGTVEGGGGDTVSYRPGCTLDFGQQYSWRVRAKYRGADGPWSADATFLAPAGGFLDERGVYDPLTNGQTVGEIFGPVTFIPDVGVRLEDFTSYIRYQLPRTLVTGEFSLIITGVTTNTEGNKTKVFAMSEGPDDIITNNRRMTVEKRGDPPGIVAWRLISHFDQIDTEGAEREYVEFDENLPYLWTATWNGFFNVRIQRGGSDGETIYSKGKPYDGAYDPEPHWAYIGAPIGRSGVEAATVPGMIVRQVWISETPRPAGLN